MSECKEIPFEIKKYNAWMRDVEPDGVCFPCDEAGAEYLLVQGLWVDGGVLPPWAEEPAWIRIWTNRRLEHVVDARSVSSAFAATDFQIMREAVEKIARHGPQMLVCDIVGNAEAASIRRIARGEVRGSMNPPLGLGPKDKLVVEAPVQVTLWGITTRAAA